MLRGGCHLRRMDDHDSQARAPGYRTGRMEAFSDGVFAIAVTLLVLEIAVPAGSGDDLLDALGDQWSSYLGYLVSFATIGAVWFAHTVITEYLDHANSVLIRLNLLLLLVVSFLPFSTKLLAEFADERVAVHPLNLVDRLTIDLKPALTESLGDSLGDSAGRAVSTHIGDKDPHRRHPTSAGCADEATVI
jgi:hypothetical protein